jgi:hypothetical protein
MPDPIVTALIASSIKLLASGLKLAMWDGWSTNWPAHDRTEWLAKLLGLSKDALLACCDILKAVLPAGSKPETAAHLWAVHVACFGEALAAYWGGSQGMAGRGGKWGKWFDPAWVRERRVEIEAAFGFALDELAQYSMPGLARVNWLEAPTSSPMYKALWSAFVDHEVAAGAVPLLPRDQTGDVQAFERAFAQAFREAMTRSGNAELRGQILGARPGEALHDLLLSDMASWRHQNVFAGVDSIEGIPELPLGTTYVEPTAIVSLGKGKKQAGPVLTVLQELLATHDVIFVTADFGHGKSLTARTLAWQWAEAYLDPSDNTPTLDRKFPVHVQCHGEVSWDLDKMVRRALKHRAQRLGVSVTLQDAALAPPVGQSTVYLLDGLDELVLTQHQMRELVREISDQASDRRCFIVFSRPEGLPRIEPGPGQPEIPHVQIQSFSAEQTDDWLWAWPRSAPSRAALERHELTELAAVPILLFMLTLTWPTYAAQKGAVNRAQIYETFFQTLAAGKYEQSGERHPQIRAAAQRARDVLVERGELTHFRTDESDGRAIEAMRWLMDRVAWEAKRCEFVGKELSHHRIGQLLEKELKLSENTLEQVLVALLLGMQAQLGGESQQFFFGHRSFMEFAVARYWERQLRKACAADRLDLARFEEALTGAPLIEHESRVFTFLCEMLRTWTDKDCRLLLDWAKKTVADESIRSADGQNLTFKTDIRTLVRQSALAIGCTMGLRLKEPFELGDGALPLTISAWWLTSRKQAPLIFAPGSHVHVHTVLSGFVGVGSHLSGAYLDFSDLTSADLSWSNISNANLSGVNFSHANLRGANFSNAILYQAIMFRADLHNANLAKSCLIKAKLIGVSLLSANLSGAVLTDADLTGADLAGADLTKANLTGACLESAILSGAEITRANFSGVRYDRRTVWPEGFVVPKDAILVIREGDYPEGQ